MVEIKDRNWTSITKRLMGLAATQWLNHSKVIKITIITDRAGNPVAWSTPECIKIEPHDSTWLNSL